MDDVTLARALHVLAVVLWIGGVGFVTSVLLPALRRERAAGRLALFVAGPLFLHRWHAARAEIAPEATFRLTEWLHWTLPALTLITVFGAVLGSHGVLLFG